MQFNNINYFYPNQYWPYQVINYVPIAQAHQIQNVFTTNFEAPLLHHQTFYTYQGLPASLQSPEQVENQLDGPQNNPAEMREENSRQSNRNMISNSLKVFRKYIKDSIATGQPFIQRIIQKNKLEYSIQEFLVNLNKLIPEKRNYYGSKFISQLLRMDQSNSNFNIVIRSALFQYYRQSIFPTVLNSKKILGKCKKVQLLAGRKIIKELMTH